MSAHKRLRWLLVAGLAALILITFGVVMVVGVVSDGSGASPTEVCQQALSSHQVAQLLDTVDEWKIHPLPYPFTRAPGAILCEYNIPHSSGIPTLGPAVDLWYRVPDAVGIFDRVSEFKFYPDEESPVATPGIGDEAVTWPGSGGYLVRQGASVFMVSRYSGVSGMLFAQTIVDNLARHRATPQAGGGRRGATPVDGSISPNEGSARTATRATLIPSASSLGSSETVTNYWNAINVGNYQEAWDLGGDNLQSADGSAQQFGVNNAAEVGTSSVAVTLVTGDQVYVNLSAAGATYSGFYTVSNGVIVSANIQQTS